MKGSLLCVGLLLGTTSCGGGDAGSDMAPADDLASVDLSPASDLLGQTGCKGLVACLNGCPPLDNGCSFGCGQASSQAGIMLYKASIDCAQTYCVNAGKCAWADAQ